MKLRCIDTECHDGYYNMAVDEMLINLVSEQKTPPVLRFYAWNPPAISLGYFQKIDESIDTRFCEKNNIDIVRRITGGRTVLHKDEITYSVIIPENEESVSGSITQTYKKISTGILEGLRYTGIDATLSPGSTQNTLTSACFEASSKYEILLNGKKLVGSAQTRKRGVILQHGSIVISFDYDLFSKCLGLNNEQREDFIRRFKEKATDIVSNTQMIFSRNDLLNNIKKGFTTMSGWNIFDDELSKSETNNLSELYEKYKSFSWKNLK